MEDTKHRKKNEDVHSKRCEVFHGPGVVLVGEAAHALGPMLAGQAVSLAFESCVVLADALR